MNQPKLNSRTLLIIGLVVIVAILFILPRLNPADNTPVPTPTTEIPSNTNDNTASNNNAAGSSSASLGRVVAATGIDRDSCPVGTASVFEPVERVYVVAEDSNIEAGTTVFVRLYRNNEPIEDAPEITADQDYTNSCVNFVFEPASGARFQTGQYEAEFIVNGNAADTVAFQIR